MAKADLAYTPSADVYWDGELPIEFRNQANSIVGVQLTDDAWAGLCRSVRAYSFLLNHEFVAATLKEQQAAYAVAIKRTDEMTAALDALECLEMGRGISHLVADEWERNVFGRVAEHDRQIDRLQVALTGTLRLHAVNDADKLAGMLVQDWRASGTLVRPSPARDFLVTLQEFRQALGLAAKRAREDKNLAAKAGDSFVELVGRLSEWANANGFKLSATKLDAYGNHGTMTRLVKALLALVPDVRREGNAGTVRSLRRPPVQDATLAEQIIKARKKYEAGRPR